MEVFSRKYKLIMEEYKIKVYLTIHEILEYDKNFENDYNNKIF